MEGIARVLATQLRIPDPLDPSESKKPNARQYRCVQCGAPVVKLFRRLGSPVVDTCRTCGRPSDPYFEYDSVHVGITTVLLRLQTWRHIVFNSRDAFLTALGLALVSLLVTVATTAALGPLADGTYTVMRLADAVRAYDTARGDTLGPPVQSPPPGAEGGPVQTGAIPIHALFETLVQPLPQLRLVHLVDNAVLQTATPLLLVLPRMLLGCAAEFALSLLATLWLVSVLAPIGGARLATSPGSSPAGALTTAGTSVAFGNTLTALCVVLTVRLALLVFFVWQAPLHFLLVVDVAEAMWYYCALGTLTGARAVTKTGGTLFGLLCTRMVVRTMTGWSPMFVWLRLMR